jgi:hypothetical protein
MNRSTIPALLAAFSLLVLSGPALSGPTEDARAAFQQGFKLYEQKQFSAAADAFEQAFALKPSYKLLFNIGQARAAARQYDLALAAFERYLVEGGDEIDDERRTSVLAELSKLRPLVGFIEVQAPAGLTVRVDGAERGTTPLKGKLMLTVGLPHKVDLLQSGKLLYSQEMQVSGGLVETLRWAPSRQDPPVEAPTAAEEGDGDPGGEPVQGPEPAPLPEDSSGGGSLKIWGWVTLGAGAAVLIAGGITGGMALSQSGKLEEACPDGGCSPSRSGEVDALGSMALTADILIGVGAAAAVAGAVLLLLPGGGEEAAGDPDEAAMRVVPAPGGAALQGRF